MSDSNRTAVGLVEEVTAGTTPAAPVFERLRIRSHSLAYRKATAESAELRSDRQTSDMAVVGFDAGGGIPMEASFGALDSVFRAVSLNEWSLMPVRHNNLFADSNVTDVAAGTGVYGISGNAGTLAAGGNFVVGHLVRASGFTNAANNQLSRATAVGANTVTLGTTTVAEAAPPIGAKLKAVGFEGAASDIVATVSGLTATALNFTTLGLRVGQWVYVGGATAGQAFATAANKGWARISSITATALGLDNLPAGWSADAGTGKTIRVFAGDMITHGTTVRSYTLEVHMQDISIYDYFRGMVCESVEIGLAARSLIDVGTSWMGRDMATQGTRFSGATDLAAAAYDIMNTSSNIGQLYENGVVLPGANFPIAASFGIRNNPRRRTGLGTAGSVGIVPGRVTVEGSLSTYFADNTVRQRVLSNTASSLMVAMIDPAGTRGYIVDVPRIKFAEGDPTTGGIDTDRTLDARFRGLRHPVLDYTYSIQRFEEFGT